MKMEPRLRLIQHLYGEADAAGELRTLLRDPELRAEYESFQRIKQDLDSGIGRTRVEAPPLQIDVTRPHSRYARFAKQAGPVRRVRGPIVWASAVATAALIAFLVWPDTSTEDEQATDGSIPLQYEEVIAGESPPPPAAADLAWDDTRERVHLWQSMDVIRERTSPELWDQSAVMSLDSLLLQASSPVGLNQVRSQRPIEFE